MPIDPSFLDAHGTSLAGAIGAAVSSALKPANTFLAAVLHLVCGALCAHYLGGPLVVYFSIGEPYHAAIFFLTGIFGLTVLRGIMAAVEKYDFAKHFPKGDK